MPELHSRAHSTLAVRPLKAKSGRSAATTQQGEARRAPTSERGKATPSGEASSLPVPRPRCATVGVAAIAVVIAVSIAVVVRVDEVGEGLREHVERREGAVLKCPAGLGVHLMAEACDDVGVGGPS